MPEETPQEAQVPAKRLPRPKDKVARALGYWIVAGVIIETSGDQIIHFLRVLTSTGSPVAANPVRKHGGKTGEELK